MIRNLIILFGFLACQTPLYYAYSIPSNPDKTTLSGKVTDKKTGEPLPGVTVYITDLKTGAVSDASGRYKIENLPASKVVVQASFVGYKLVVEALDLSVTSTKNFEMEEAVNELNEVVVTGLSQAGERDRTPTPIATVAKIQLLQSSSSNIIDAISHQAGVSEVTTGSGISKPVIRGLGYNRVVTVNDGIRQEGNQWGDEHGIEIDEFGVSKVEILKGPASLSYGSDAMAGVINFLSSPTLPEGTLQGNILANYQTNDGLKALSGNFAGNQKGFIWDIRYSNKKAHSYRNKYDGYVFNSGYEENNVGGIVGVNRAWGYSHLHFSVYHSNPGIIEGDRDETTGQFIKPVALNASTEGTAIATNDDFKSYTQRTPFQQIRHYKAVLNNSLILGNGSLKTTLGWQQNRRQEFGDVLSPNEYGLFFLLNTINYDVNYNLPEKGGLNLSFGLNGMKQIAENKGTEFLVPAYNLFDIGAFSIFTKSLNNLNLSGGIRYDLRTQHGQALFINPDGKPTSSGAPNAIEQFKAFDVKFSGVSGSVGATYHLSGKVFTKINLSRGFRAPNIAELGSNGVHEGTTRYELGDATLKPESSLQVDAALGYRTDHITAEFDLFSNRIHDFIFPSKLASVFGGDSLSDGFQTFKYEAANAQLWGGEATIDLHPHPLDWLHFENAFSFVRAFRPNEPASSKYLPFTPSPKFTSELRANVKHLSPNLENAYLKIGMDHYFKQDRFYAANGTETATPAYTLVNMGMGTDVVSNRRTLCSLYLSLNNLTDVAYQSHLSRLKYTAENMATGRMGIFNMGRNISLKLLVPLGFKS
jgi:iron complex outermembrane receptor protein